MASKPNAKICSLCDLFHVIACVIFGVISFNFLLVVRNFAKVTSPSFNNFCSLAVLHSRPICRYVGLWVWGPRRGCRYGLTGGWVRRSCWVEAAAAVTQHDLLTQPQQPIPALPSGPPYSWSPTCLQIGLECQSSSPPAQSVDMWAFEYGGPVQGNNAHEKIKIFLY